MSMVHITQQLEAKVMELTCRLDQTAHRKMLDAMKAVGSGSGGGVGGGGAGAASSTNSGATASAGMTESNEAVEPTAVGSAFPKVSFDVNRSKPVSMKDDDKPAVPVCDEPKKASRYPSFDIKGHVDVIDNLPAEVTVVVARDEVSVAGSTFTDTSPEALHPDQLPTEAAPDLADFDLPLDSGAASRTSYRVDSDASIRSVSEHSLATGDSGCWPKE